MYVRQCVSASRSIHSCLGEVYCNMFSPLDKDKLGDYTFITQLTKTFSWKGPGDPDLRGRGFLSVSQFCCISILHVIFAFHGTLITYATNAISLSFDFLYAESFSCALVQCAIEINVNRRVASKNQLHCNML